MNILITGGTGLIGRHLSKMLKAKGHKLILASRSNKKPEQYDDLLQWDTNQLQIKKEPELKTDVVINLAGAGIADEKWTDKRKQLIRSSRVNSSKLLQGYLSKRNEIPQLVVSASAIGFYGSVTHNNLMNEESKAETDFMGKTCAEWEEAGKQISPSSRLFVPRIGIVLANDGGALPKLKTAAKWYSGAPLGSGNQHMPWIHIDDLCSMIVYAIENESINGIFNAVAATHCTNRDFTQALCKALHRPMWPIPVPSLIIKTLFGEMSTVVLNGCPVDNQKIKNSGFKFQYDTLEKVFNDLFK
jgi:uncharacterized protein (TIGR01777 family)